MKAKLGMIVPEPPLRPETALEVRINSWFYARRKPGQKPGLIDFCWFMRDVDFFFFVWMFVAYLAGERGVEIAKARQAEYIATAHTRPVWQSKGERKRAQQL
jgi:hypothetical protein